MQSVKHLDAYNESKTNKNERGPVNNWMLNVDLGRFFVLDLRLQGAQAAAQQLCSLVVVGKQRLPHSRLRARDWTAPWRVKSIKLASLRVLYRADKSKHL